MINMAKTSFQMDDSTMDWVESRLVYGQSKSAWFRYAAQTTVEVDEVLDELYESHEYEKRREFILNAVSEKVEETKQDPHRGNGN